MVVVSQEGVHVILQVSFKEGKLSTWTKHQNGKDSFSEALQRMLPILWLSFEREALQPACFPPPPLFFCKVLRKVW